MGKISIECEIGNVSDGYHTFNELYEHRIHLFMMLMVMNPEISWRAQSHSDGSSFDGWFIAGMHLPTGDISYHLPMRVWPKLKRIKTLQAAPNWDGHTAADVIARLSQWIDVTS